MAIAQQARVFKTSEDFTESTDVVGQIPAMVAPGYVISRCADNSRSRAAQFRRKFVPALRGAMSEFDSTVPLIANEDVFETNSAGELLYDLDLLIVRRESVASNEKERKAKKIALFRGKFKRTRMIDMSKLTTEQEDDVNRVLQASERLPDGALVQTESPPNSNTE